MGSALTNGDFKTAMDEGKARPSCALGRDNPLEINFYTDNTDIGPHMLGQTLMPFSGGRGAMTEAQVNTQWLRNRTQKRTLGVEQPSVCPTEAICRSGPARDGANATRRGRAHSEQTIVIA